MEKGGEGGQVLDRGELAELLGESAVELIVPNIPWT